MKCDRKRASSFGIPFCRARCRLVLATAVLLPLMAITDARGQAAAGRTMRLVVGYSPGGATDVQARLLAAKLGPITGASVIVENRPGASGMIGAQAVVRAAPDGNTLLVAGPNEAAINVALFKSMPYDPVADLAPITLFTSAPVVLVANTKMGLKSLADVVKAAKAPATLAFGSVGIGTPNHVSGELLNQLAGTALTHVPFQGAGPAMGAVVGNHVPLAFLSLASAVPQIKSGALQPIALTTARRFPTHPDIPTIAEQGYPSFNISSWYGVLGPAKMPPDLIAKLNADIVSVLKDPEVREKLLDLGADPVGSSPAEFADLVNTEIRRYRDLAQRAGIQPQ